jgi:hypothetical protein
MQTIVSGEWEHIFPEGRRRIRFAADGDGRLIALEVQGGNGWRAASQAEWADVQDSLVHGNAEALDLPAAFGLTESPTLPVWAAS